MIRIFDEAGSTQDEMKLWAGDGTLRNLDAVLAYRQAAGRGRRGSRWIPGERGFYASIFLEIRSLPPTWLPLWLGCVVREALVVLEPGLQSVLLKWPNDLMASVSNRDAKLGGLLCEMQGRGVIAGMGVNLARAPGVEGRSVADLETLLGKNLSGDFEKRLLEKTISGLQHEPQVDELRDRWNSVSWFQSGELLVWRDSEGAAEHRGTFVGLGDFGELLVDPEEGSGRIRLFSEEVSRIRASTPPA